MSVAPIAPRVLHLMSLPDGGYDQALAYAASEAGRAGTGGGQSRSRLVVIGPAVVRSHLAALGVEPDAVIVPPLHAVLGRAATAGPALRRWLRDNAAGAGEGFDVVHCWSIDARDLAMRVFDRRTPVVCTPVRAPRGAADLAACPDAVLAPLAEDWTVAGVPTALLPLPSLAMRGADRQALRAVLRVGEGELAIVLLADPPSVGSARVFASQVGVMRLAGISAVGVVPAGIGHFRRGIRHTARHDHAWDLVATNLPSAALLSAADIVVWQRLPHASLNGRSGTDESRGGGVLAAHLAACAGVPVLALDETAAREALGHDGPPALIANNFLPAWGQRLFEIAPDRAVLAGAAAAQQARALARCGDFASAVSSLHQRAIERRASRRSSAVGAGA